MDSSRTKRGGVTSEAITTKETLLARFWIGRLEGTNQGWILARIRVLADGAVRGRALINDDATGAFTVKVVGRLDGKCLTLNLKNFRTRSHGVNLPPLGELVLTLNDLSNEASGTWSTLVGTNGTCKLNPCEMGARQWYSALLSAWRGFVWQLAKWIFSGALPWLYVAGLATLLVLSGTNHFVLSYPQMVLALVPAPFLFSDRIAEIIRAWKIAEIGPIKIQAPILDRLDPELPWMSHLDFVLVPRSKQLLYWLTRYGTVSRSAFETTARSVGVPAENFQATWDALIASKCATTDGSNLSISPLGQRYVAHVYGSPVPQGG
jgi:hypothetical protein